MRYIRTKDGKIYELQKTKSGEKYLVKTSELIPLWNTKAREVIKQADTIKELCDEFVFHTTDGYEQHFVSQGHLEDVLSNEYIDLKEYLSCRTIYGAIWTDKGLLYVAKLNEKGEFELL